MKTPIYNTNRTPMPSSGAPSLNVHLEVSLNKTTLDITSRVMLRYIDRHGPQGFDALLAQFGDSDLPSAGRDKMRSRLNHLVDAGHLQTSGQRVRNSGLGVTYSLGVRHGGTRPPQADAATPVAPPPSRPATPLPPHDPSVRLPRAARPGADDYLHIPSLRGGQRVPYRVAYVAALGSKGGV